MARATRPQLAVIAQALRHSPTDSEAILWQALRRNQLGTTFRRQVPLRGYITDFYASTPKLIIEVDGPYHADRTRADARRDRDLANHGYRILRLRSDLVLHAVAEAIAHVRAALAP
jgi:very-short-patch-repair endonuclease